MEIQTESLNLAIDNKTIVEKITLEVKNKEFVGIIGPNGSGKSTILRALYRSLKPQSGRIFFDGEDLEMLSLQQTAQRLGVMKQNSTLNFDFKVLDLVLMGRTPYKKPFELDSQADYKLAQSALAAVGLNGYEERLYNQLSGGEQQRVMIARVLTGQPQTLLLDEMTNHLDLYYQFHLLELIKNMQVEVLAVMHDLNLAAKFCQKLYLLKDGKIIAFGNTKDVLCSPIIEETFKIKIKPYNDEDGQLHLLYKDAK